MSTITKEFTKEQLIARINQVTAINKYRISRDPDADGLAMDNELLAIALASLNAEIHSYTFEEDPHPLYTAPPAPVDNIHPLLEFAREYIESWDLGMAGDSSLLASAKKAIADSSAQQPAPFVLPVQHWEDLCRQNPDMSIGDAIIRAAWWNHCAAMLQGAEPVSNRDELPVWVACSERMPEWSDDVLCATEFDGPGDWRKKVGYWHDGKWVIYGGSWTPTHWMPLPAAPQQECKHEFVYGWHSYGRKSGYQCRFCGKLQDKSND